MAPGGAHRHRPCASLGLVTGVTQDPGHCHAHSIDSGRWLWVSWPAPCDRWWMRHNHERHVFIFITIGVFKHTLNRYTPSIHLWSPIPIIFFMMLHSYWYPLVDWCLMCVEPGMVILGGSKFYWYSTVCGSNPPPAYLFCRYAPFFSPLEEDFGGKTHVGASSSWFLGQSVYLPWHLPCHDRCVLLGFDFWLSPFFYTFWLAMSWIYVIHIPFISFLPGLYLHFGYGIFCNCCLVYLLNTIASLLCLSTYVLLNMGSGLIFHLYLFCMYFWNK